MTKTAIFSQDVAWVQLNPHEHKDIFSENQDYSFGALIWKTYDIKFCKEAKTIIVVGIWLNSLTFSYSNFAFINDSSSGF